MKNYRKKMTITIGIPAHNEEANIAKLLDSVLIQKDKNYLIEKIIVVSDSSKDETNNIVLEYKSKNIDLVINPKRKGQIFGQNLIFKLAKSDLVVLFEADTYLQNELYLSKLIQPVIKDSEIGLVQGYMKPFEVKTLVQRALNLQFKIFTKIVFVRNFSKNPIPSGRGGRVFTKRVYQNLLWPTQVPEDEYAFLWCVSRKIKVHLEKNAVCLFKFPQDVPEYLKQMQKNRSASVTIGKYFSSEIISKNMSTSYKEKIIIFLLFLYKNPLLCLVYIALRIVISIETKNTEFVDF